MSYTKNKHKNGNCMQGMGGGDGGGGDPVKTGPKCWVIIANLSKEDLIEDEKEKNPKTCNPDHTSFVPTA